MTLFFRFDEENNIREYFIWFIHCKDGFSGEKRAKVIISTIDNLSLDINHCRDQGYDGAGAFAGHINGCSAHFLGLNIKAVYLQFFHCFSLHLFQPRKQVWETAATKPLFLNRGQQNILVFVVLGGYRGLFEMFVAIVQTCLLIYIMSVIEIRAKPQII